MAGLWQFLQTYAAGITAVGGVLTFIVGVVKYLYDAQSERKSIQGGFLVEIERLLWVIRRHLDQYEDFKNDPLIPFTTDFYDKQVQNVGKIAGDLVPDTVRFYGFVKFLNQVQAARPGYFAEGKRNEFHEFYTARLGDFLLEFEDRFNAHFERYGVTRSADIVRSVKRAVPAQTTARAPLGAP